MLDVFAGVLEEQKFLQAADSFITQMQPEQLAEFAYNAPIAQLAAALRSAGANVSDSDMQIMQANTAAHAAEIESAVRKLGGKGLIEYAVKQMQRAASHAPAAYRPGKQGAQLRKVSDSGNSACGSSGDDISWYSGWASGYLFIMSLACPPLALGLGIASGVIGLIAVFCAS